MAAPQDYFQRIDLTDTANGGTTGLNRTGDNVREDFLDAIENIAPTATPFMSGIGRASCDDVFTSWLQDTLAEPDDGNAAKDGDDIGADTSARARRVGNACQISRKNIIVTGRAEKVDKAGRSSELAYQVAKAGKALKRDMEAILTGNQSALLDSDGNTASLLGSLQACFRAGVDPEDTTCLVGAGAGALGGVGTDGLPNAYTPGTARTLTQTLLDTVIEACYVNGGEPDTIMVNPANKRKISEYLFTSSARVAALYSDVGQPRGDSQGTALGAVDVYISDFGQLRIVPNRFLGYKRNAGNPSTTSSGVFVLDMSKWAVGYLRPFSTKKIAPTGDAEKRILMVDYTLIYREEMASGAILDIDTNAMTA
jgi:hypothetical protein